MQPNSQSVVIKGYKKQIKDVTLKACNGKIITNDKKEVLSKCFNGTYYEKYTRLAEANGYVEEYYSGEHCYNPIM